MQRIFGVGQNIIRIAIHGLSTDALKSFETSSKYPNGSTCRLYSGTAPRNEQLPGLDERGRDIVIHCIAFFQCVYLVEKTMREVWPDEVALLIAEDRPVVRQTLREVQSGLQKKALPRMDHQEDLPLQHIRDTVHWAGKEAVVATSTSGHLCLCHTGALKRETAQPASLRQDSSHDGRLSEVRRISAASD